MSMKTIEMDYHGEKIVLTFTKYRDNDRLALAAESTDGEPYGVFTVNLDEEEAPEGTAYLDTNNFPDIEEHLRSIKLIEAEPIGHAFSGFCVYPLYKFMLNHEE